MIAARLASGDIDLVTNCMVLSEGWDLPEVACSGAADEKNGPLSQIIGPRAASGREPDAIVLDHSGAVFRHGFVEDRVEWSLAARKRRANTGNAARIHHHG